MFFFSFRFLLCQQGDIISKKQIVFSSQYLGLVLNTLVFFSRYHKLVWGPQGIEDQGLPSGVLIAGGENGNIILYDASKVIAGESEVIISQSEKHSGPVRALDVNSFQVRTLTVVL